jgi:hypothetical protein
VERARCHRDNPVEANFCLECGARLGTLCEACSGLVPPEAKFCPACGAAVVEPARTPYTPAYLSKRILLSQRALTQEVAYDGLLEGRRRELHAFAGRAIESSAADALDEQYELLAHHYAHSDEAAKAVEYLTLANRKAAARNAMEEALDYFYAALAALEQLPDSDENRYRRTSLVLDQMIEFHFLHRHREYWDLLLRIEPLVRVRRAVPRDLRTPRHLPRARPDPGRLRRNGRLEAAASCSRTPPSRCERFLGAPLDSACPAREFSHWKNCSSAL